MSKQKAITFERDGGEREALMACLTYRSGPVEDPRTAILVDYDDSRQATPADLIAALQQNDDLRSGVLAGITGVVVAAIDHSTISALIAGAFAWYSIREMERWL